MATLLWGCAAVLLGFAAHVLFWRLRVPRRQTRGLLLIFFGVLGLVLAGLAIARGTDGPVPLPRELPEFVQIALFGTACTLGYIITYSAVEADSPTLVMVNAIAAAGPGGLDEAAFFERVSDDVLIRPRVADLVRDQMLTFEGRRYTITPKGRRFVAVFIRFRGLLGAGKGG